ncbi:MAG: PaaI family thioesterase [Acidimicrobiia bacterium]|nr:PaaI family thioesterase [Acidimicrobiia bacterium]
MAGRYFVYPDPQFDQRTDTADALRRLTAALVGHAADDASLARIASWARDVAADVEQGERLERGADYQARRYLDPPPEDGDELISFSDRPVSGPANASALDLRIRREGREAVGVAIFDRRFEASPNRSHGGITAACFDDVMGYVNIIDAVAAYTLELHVRYVAPMPLHVPVEFRARTVERSERRSTVTAEATAPDGTRVGEASAVFAIVAREKFGI